jgi:hypothetical protein
MNSIKNYLHQLLSDPNGIPSSKRMISILCVFLMALGYIANLFWDYTVDEFMFNAIMYIVIGGLGFTVTEAFAPKK